MEDNKSWLATIGVVIILVVVIAGSAGFYYLADQNRRLGEVIMAANQQQNDVINQIRAQVDSLKSEELVSPATQSPTSSVVIPDGFKSYTNDKLGFSLNIPINVSTNSGKLESVEVVESGSVVYLTYKSNYYYKDVTKRASSNLNDIAKVTGVPWGILVKSVSSDQELTTLIKNRYGSSCSIGSQKLSSQDGVYDVIIKGDGKDLGTTKCPINFIYHIKYSPTLKKAALWDIGQDYNFLVKGVIDADSLMSDSFNFIK